MNGHFEEINKNKYLTPVPTKENKEIIKIFGELWSKMKDLIRSITTDSDDCIKNIWKSNLIWTMIYL